MAARIVAAIAGALSLGLAACGSGGGGKSLAVIVAGPPDAAAAEAALLTREATEATLIGRDGLGQAVPGLASSWRFVDGGRTLILRLKPLRWSDGAPLVADDVVASFRRALAPAGRSPLKAGLAAIDNAEAVAAGTLPPARLGVLAPTSRVVEIRMNAAMPGLLAWLAQPDFAVTRPGKAGKPQLSLGLYRAATGDGGPALQRITEEPSGAALPARITVSIVTDPIAAATRLAAGKADLVIGNGLDGLEAVTPVAPPNSLRTEVVWGTYGYLANTRFGPLGDVRVRRALAMAVDRAALAGRFGGSGVAPLTGLVPPALASGDPVAPDWANMDLSTRQAVARELLASAGFGETRALRVTLLLTPGGGHRAIAAAVARDWSAIGALMSTTALEPAAFDRAVAKGDYDLALAERRTPVADRAFLLRRFACTPHGYCNAAADAAVTGSLAQSPESAAAALSGAEAAMLADVPMIPLVVPVRWALVRRGLSGWAANPASAHPLGQLVMGGDATLR